MGCDWIQIDKELERKPEFLMLRAASGEEEAVVGWRLKKFWSWVDDHVPTSGRITKITRDALAIMFGGDEKFWAAMESVGWLGSDENGLFIPDWKKRFGKSAKARKLSADRSKRYREKKTPDASRCERVTVTPEDDERARDERVTRHANHAIRKEKRRGEEIREEETSNSSSNSLRASTSSASSGSNGTPDVLTLTPDALKNIKGDDGEMRAVDWDEALIPCREIVAAVRRSDAPADRELVAKVAALEQLGAISQHERCDACVAVAKKAEKEPGLNRYAYLHATLTSKLKDRQVTFNALLAAVTVPEELIRVTPERKLRA